MNVVTFAETDEPILLRSPDTTVASRRLPCEPSSQRDQLLGYATPRPAEGVAGRRQGGGMEVQRSGREGA